MTYLPPMTFSSKSTDAFGRLIVAPPEGLFDAQFTYDLQPLLYEQITSGTGATIAHDATNRNALMTFSSTPTGGKAFMQSYEYFRYQVGKSQDPVITFNFIEAKANCLKFAEYGDGTNGIAFQNDGINNKFVINSSTSNSNQVVLQENWNIDNLTGVGDGKNPSGKKLDITKGQVLIMQIAALYTDGVKVGFQIDNTPIWCHRFSFANSAIHPYIASANLPIRVGMTCTATVSTTMKFNCATAISGGGQEQTNGNQFAIESNVTLASGTNTHILSLRPKATFNGIVNRVKMGILEISIAIDGVNGADWYLVLGQAISGTTTFTDVNTTYSAFEYNTAGTLSGNPAIIIDSSGLVASNQLKTSEGMNITQKYPITLDAAGNPRLNGTITLYGKGIGGSTAIRAKVKITELR